MDFVANENVPRVVVGALRQDGHDVSWVRTEAPGATDLEVLAIAARDKRILLTFDKDFGELAFRAHLPVDTGVVLCRSRMATPERMRDHLRSALASRTDWAGYFSVIEDDRIRMTALPTPADPER